MNRLWTVFSTLFLGLVLAGCGDNSSTAKKPFPLLGGTEVLRSVYDDHQSTAYIKADRSLWDKEDAALADIMTQKKEWERQFPAKKVVAMSVITGDHGYSYPYVAGLLIQYELR